MTISLIEVVDLVSRARCLFILCMTSKPSDTEPESYYFELQASWGLTKHMGGLGATRELIEACRIDEDSRVLDVGSGVGITACLLAGEYGCDVVGIDLSEKMLQRARERACRKKVERKTQFQIGDARDLPFEDGVFDAVVCESVVAFPEDKQKVVDEFARVTRPGGWVGMNEVTWVETPPSELAGYLYRALGRAEFLDPAGWQQLLETAGLTDVTARIYRTSAVRQWVSEIQQMNPGDYLKAWGRFFTLSFTSPGVRKWLKDIMIPPRSIFRLFRYFGYGLYLGRK